VDLAFVPEEDVIYIAGEGYLIQVGKFREGNQLVMDVATEMKSSHLAYNFYSKIGS
jgi:hypothetical protein